MKLRNLSARSNEIELMDSENVSYAEFHNCLHHLEWINIFTLAYWPTFLWLKKILRHNSIKEKIVIYDIGSGGGDMLRHLAKWGSRSKIKFSLTGIDINSWAKKSAESVTPKNSAIKFITADIFSLSAAHQPDYIISSLFAHHLDEKSLVKFLRWMNQQASCGWFINDLHRHFIPYYFIKAVTHSLPVNRLVRNDAAVSVARAFTQQDWWNVIDKAAISRERIKIQWHFPFRYSVTCNKL